MRIAQDPVSQVLEAAAAFENVQKAAAQEQVAQDVRLIRATHQAAAPESGQGQNVDIVV